MYEKMGTGHWYTIELKHRIDKFDFKLVLSRIMEEFEGEIDFVGWLSGRKVISLDEENYVVTAGDDWIKLRYTKDKTVYIFSPPCLSIDIITST